MGMFDEFLPKQTSDKANKLPAIPAKEERAGTGMFDEFLQPSQPPQLANTASGALDLPKGVARGLIGLPDALESTAQTALGGYAKIADLAVGNENAGQGGAIENSVNSGVGMVRDYTTRPLADWAEETMPYSQGTQDAQAKLGTDLEAVMGDESLSIGQKAGKAFGATIENPRGTSPSLIESIPQFMAVAALSKGAKVAEGLAGVGKAEELTAKAANATSRAAQEAAKAEARISSANIAAANGERLAADGLPKLATKASKEADNLIDTATKARAFSATKAAEAEALKAKAAIADKVQNAAIMGLGNATLEGAGASNAARDEFLGLAKNNPDQLMKNPQFAQLANEKGFDEAVRITAEMTGSDAFAPAALVGAGASLVTGGGLEGALFNRLAGKAGTNAIASGVAPTLKAVGGGILTGGGKEFSEETIQGASGQYAQNVAMQPYTDVDPMKGVVEQAASGGAMGLLSGGVGGGAGRAYDKATRQSLETDQANQLIIDNANAAKAAAQAKSFADARARGDILQAALAAGAMAQPTPKPSTPNTGGDSGNAGGAGGSNNANTTEQPTQQASQYDTAQDAQPSPVNLDTAPTLQPIIGNALNGQAAQNAQLDSPTLTGELVDNKEVGNPVNQKLLGSDAINGEVVRDRIGNQKLLPAPKPEDVQQAAVTLAEIDKAIETKTLSPKHADDLLRIAPAVGVDVADKTIPEIHNEVENVVNANIPAEPTQAPTVTQDEPTKVSKVRTGQNKTSSAQQAAEVPSVPPGDATVSTQPTAVKPSGKTPKDNKDAFVKAWVNTENRKAGKKTRTATEQHRDTTEFTRQAQDEYDNRIVTALNNGEKLSAKTEIPDHGLTIEEFRAPLQPSNNSREAHNEAISNAKSRGLVIRNQTPLTNDTKTNKPTDTAQSTTQENSHKEPHELTKQEWEKQRDAQRAETFGSAGKPSANQATLRVIENKRLLGYYAKDIENAQDKLKDAKDGKIKISKDELYNVMEVINNRPTYEDVVNAHTNYVKSQAAQETDTQAVTPSTTGASDNGEKTSTKTEVLNEAGDANAEPATQFNPTHTVNDDGDSVPVAKNENGVWESQDKTEYEGYDAEPIESEVAKQGSKKPLSEMEDLKAQMGQAIGEAVSLLGGKMNMTEEEETKLVPIMAKIFRIAAKMGFIKFKETASYVMEQIRELADKETADKFTLEHLLGGYASAGGKDFVGMSEIKSLEDLLVEPKADSNSVEFDSVKTESKSEPAKQDKSEPIADNTDSNLAGKDKIKPEAKQSKPATKTLHSLIASGNVNEVLEHIIANSATPLHPILANKLIGQLPDGINISVVDTLKNKRGTEGVMNYDYNTKTVSVNLAVIPKLKESATEKGFIHELIHAVTGEKINAIMGNTDESTLTRDEKVARTQLKLIANLINKHIKENNVTGDLKKVSELATENLRELITYGLTEPVFQKMLADIKMGKDKTAWTQFVHAIAKLLGIELNQEQETALSALLMVGDSLLGDKATKQISKPIILNGFNVTAFSEKLLNGDSLKTIVQARKELSDTPIQAGTVQAKQADEAIELAGVIAARQIVAKGMSKENTFDALSALAEQMPSLNVRTSTSIAEQAYSTPLALAYVASVRAGIDSNTSVVEPTAGNGALLIAVNPDNAIVNELNKGRAKALESQGFTVTTNNAANYGFGNADSDVVIANPPFGTVKDENGNTQTFPITSRYKTNEIDHAIAFNALKAMKDDGKAVLIVGGVMTNLSDTAREDKYNGAAKRAFYGTLYNEYNVVDHFTVSGDLYAKQGAGYPVDVIVINGKGKSELLLPAAGLPRVIQSTEELKNELQDNRVSLQESREATKQTATTGTTTNDVASGTNAKQSRDSIADKNGRGDNVFQSGLRNDTETVRGNDATNNQLGNSAVSRPNGTTKLSDTRTTAPQRIENSFQAEYTPSSGVNSIGTLVPINMQSAINSALAKLNDKYTSVDNFVASQLNYEADDLGKYFSAEQVDAIALALDNIINGKGFIIGDQTGVGKGRVNAAMIRYAILNNITPIFVTEKPNLYSDMIRDLNDIGMGSVMPFATNSGSDGVIPLNKAALEWDIENSNAKENNLPAPKIPSDAIFAKVGDTQKAKEMAQMVYDGKLSGYDAVFTTYSQMQTIKGAQTDRMDFIEAVSKGALLILDESHNAGGTSVASRKGAANGGSGATVEEGTKGGRAGFTRQLVQNSQGVFYSSATYAKRPDVLDLYSKTDMGLIADPQQLKDSLQAGGVPLQQAVASMLAQAGQYIRREKSFDGIVYDTVFVDVDRKFAERASEIMRDIMQFDVLKASSIKGLDKELKADARKMSSDRSTGAAGASSSNFTSVMHNMIGQMLLMLKVQPAIDEALAALKRGEKPVITLSNTMGSAIDEYAEDAGLNVGDAIGLHFGDLLARYLSKSRRVIEGDMYGKKESRYLNDEELGVVAAQFYKDVMDKIDRYGFDKYPVSPIDAIHNALHEAGYKTGEITGRNSIIDYSESIPVYKKRPASQKNSAGKRKTISDFNNGMIDAVILNQSGATGLSLHSSPKVGTDTRKRHMIIAQPELNIDTHMQMLGRVNRTGQSNLPSYGQLTANIPAEKRPSAILAKKMAGLNAATTAGKDSAVKAKDVPDFMNDYGDEVAAAVMNDNRDIHALLGVPLKEKDTTGFDTDGAMRRVTGRIPVLSLADQEKVYTMLEDAYDEYIDMLNKTGQNQLEAKAMALDAKTVSTTQVVKPTSGSDSPFAEGVNAEIVDAKRLGKPYTIEQILGLIKGKTGITDSASLREWRAIQIAKVHEAYKARMDEINAMPTEDDQDIKQKRGATDMLDAWSTKIIKFFNDFSPTKGVLIFSPTGGQYLGFVGNLERKGDAKNFFAMGNWKLTVYVADAAKNFTIPLSRITAGSVTEGKWSIEPTSQDIKKAIEEGSSESREERTILTGNMLAAYAFDKSGQIVNYTNNQGDTKQGILMPKKFDLAKALDDKPVVFQTARIAQSFIGNSTIDPAFGIRSADNQLRIIPQQGNYSIRVPASKAQGGQYFLNPRLTSVVEGENFVKRGNEMVGTFNKESLGSVLDILYPIAGKLQPISKEKGKEFLESTEIKPSQSTKPTNAALPSNKQPHLLTQSEFRELYPDPLQRVATNPDLDKRIIEKAGSNDPKKIFEYYQGLYPDELGDVDIQILPSPFPTRSSFDVKTGTNTDTGEVVAIIKTIWLTPKFSEQELKDWNQKGGGVDLSTPSILRHEIEHAIDYARGKKEGHKPTSNPKQGGKATFKDFDHANFSVDFLHRALVNDALKEGLSVPDKVLADYPELQDRTGVFESRSDKPTNSHTKDSFSKAFTIQLDKQFGHGWTKLLMATGKVKVVSNEEADRVISGGELFSFKPIILDYNDDISRILVDTGKGEKWFNTDDLGIKRDWVGINADSDDLPELLATLKKKKSAKQEIYDEEENVPYEIDKDGNAIVYHATSKANANKILKSGVFQAGSFFEPNANSTLKHVTGRIKNPVILKVRIKKDLLGSAAAGAEIYVDDAVAFTPFDKNKPYFFESDIDAQYSKNGKVQAFYNPANDTTYFVAENIDKNKDLLGLAAHELGVHALQLGKDDKNFKAILSEVESMITANSSTAIKKALARAKEANTKPEHVTEEVLAYLVENHPRLTLVQKFLNWFRSKLRAIGKALPPVQRTEWFRKVTALNESDLVGMAISALRVAPNDLLFDSVGRSGDAIKLAKAKGYEGSSTGEAEEWLRAVAKGLDMSQKARMARAKAMGFDVDKVWYHGSSEIIKKIGFGNIFDGLFLSESEDNASSHGTGVLNEFISTDKVFDGDFEYKHDREQLTDLIKDRYPDATEDQINEILFPAIVEDNFNPWDYSDEGEILELTGVDDLGEASWQFQNDRGRLAKQLGYDIVSMNDEHGTSYFAPKGSKIRNVNAAFDPDYADSPNLLASKKDTVTSPLLAPNGKRSNSTPANAGSGAKTLKQLELENRYTLPKIPSGNIFSNGVGDVSQDLRIKADDAFESGDTISQQVSIKDIVPTQRNITTHNLKSTKKYKDEPVNLILKDGKYYVSDGHHRISHAILNGDSAVSANVFSDDNASGIMYSMASAATDFFTGKPRRTTSLSDIDTMINTGKQPTDKLGWQYYFDKAVTTFTDSTRPFARFVQDTFDSEQASKLLSGADRALGMKAAYEKDAMNLFGRPIADGIRDIVKETKMDYKTAKDLTGYWMSARYSAEANDWLMTKDQNAIDTINADIAVTTDPDELKALNKQLAKTTSDQTKRIAAINDPNIIDPTEQKTDAGVAGGFNKATAAKLMADIEAKIPRAMLDAVANPTYDMNAWKLKNDIKDGKISKATADKFPKSKIYVPLTGDPRTDDSVEDYFSTGSVNQASDKQLGGRTGSIAQNGIDASFEQLEKSARYHGWNDFKTALTDTYNSLIADKVATGMTQKEAEQAVFDEFDIKRRPETGMIPASENDIIVRKDGKGMIYTINNQAAMEALRSVNNEDVPSILKPIAFFTRFQARMVTQLMPLFAPTNMLRDVAERSENIRTRKIQGYADLDMNKVANQAIGESAKLLIQLKPVMMGVLAENTPLAKAFPVDSTNQDVIMLKQFLALGGSSTYGDMLSGDSKSLAEKLRKTGTITDKAMDAIELWNNSFEMISGFSIYKSLVTNGVSDKDAAASALNLMNFRKRGKVMSPLRALYMFAQPIATGGHQMAMTLSTRRGQARFAAYTVAAMMLYAMLSAGDDDDDIGVNKMDEAGNFNLYRNILVPMGNGQYFKIPVGFGMQQLAWSHGVNAIRTMRGDMTAGEAVAESASLWARSGMPVAPAETSMLKNPMVWLAQTFSPQAAKPLVNIALDVNSFGAPLTNSRYERQDTAKALQGRRDTPQIYKDIAQVFAQNGIDFYPEQAREFIRDYGAGAGNEILKWAVENPAKKSRGLSTSIPLIDRYVLQTNDDSLKQRLYYRARDRMNELNVRESNGDTLSPSEKKMANLGDKLKKLEGSTRGKMAAATKAEKAGHLKRAESLRKQADAMRNKQMDYAFRTVHAIES